MSEAKIYTCQLADQDGHDGGWGACCGKIEVKLPHGTRNDALKAPDAKIETSQT